MREPILHILFWFLLFMLSLSMIQIVFPQEYALKISTFRVSTMAGIAYAHAFLAFPLLFRKKKYFLYALSILLFSIIFIQSHQLIAYLWPFTPEFIEARIKKPSFPPAGKGPGMIPQFFLLLTILSISALYALGKAFIEKNRLNRQLEQEKIKHELNFLRSQINPHFIFNTLNNLHAKVQLHPDYAEEFILKLGEMLRYVLEDCKKQTVSLEEEIKYLNNYIYFQQQQDNAFQHIYFHYTGDAPTSFMLEPMLFIPIVENAFIHSYCEEQEKRHIKLSMHLSTNALEFYVFNSIPTTPFQSHIIERKQSGLGLKNIERRLELLYPNAYQLTYKKTENTFDVKLIINRKRNEN